MNYEKLKEIVAERVEKIVSKNVERKISKFPLVTIMQPDGQGNVIMQYNEDEKVPFSSALVFLSNLCNQLDSEFTKYRFNGNIDDNSVIYIAFSTKVGD